MFCISDELLRKLLLPQRIPLALGQCRTSIKAIAGLHSLIRFVPLLLLWKQVSWKLCPMLGPGAASPGRGSGEKVWCGERLGLWAEGTLRLLARKKLSWVWFSLHSVEGERQGGAWASLHSLRLATQHMRWLPCVGWTGYMSHTAMPLTALSHRFTSSPTRCPATTSACPASHASPAAQPRWPTAAMSPVSDSARAPPSSSSPPPWW